MSTICISISHRADPLLKNITFVVKIAVLVSFPRPHPSPCYISKCAPTSTKDFSHYVHLVGSYSRRINREMDREWHALLLEAGTITCSIRLSAQCPHYEYDVRYAGIIEALLNLYVVSGGIVTSLLSAPFSNFKFHTDDLLVS
jgi:hypothetical protein